MSFNPTSSYDFNKQPTKVAIPDSPVDIELRIQKLDAKIAILKLPEYQLRTKAAQLAEEAVDSANKIKELRQKIDDLQRKIADTEDLASQVFDMKPFVDIGVAARARFLEKQLPVEEQNREIIENGNRAVHEGNAVADALLFQYPGLFGIVRRDIESYKSIYGQPFHYVLYCKNNPQFMDLCSWHGSMWSDNPSDRKSSSAWVTIYNDITEDLDYQGVILKHGHYYETAQNLETRQRMSDDMRESSEARRRPRTHVATEKW